jgi:hypothetical protein
MATDAEKQQRLLKVFNISMYGLINGLWDLFGESSFATVNSVGDRILSTMEKESGLEIQGENPRDILLEVTRLLADEIGTMKSGTVTMTEDGKVSIACEKCFLREATSWLEADGVQPFACVPMNISAAAMRKRLGTRHRVLGRKWDPATETCTIEFELVH